MIIWRITDMELVKCITTPYAFGVYYDGGRRCDEYNVDTVACKIQSAPRTP